MRRVLRNSSEVFHFWANQTQEYGECGNVHFKGPILRSYRAEIGNIINPKTALITNRKWSITTSGHTSAAARAASHLTRLYVYNPVPDCIKHHRENLKSIRDEISDAAEKERRARAAHMKQRHSRRRLERAETFSAYVALFKLEKMAAAEYPGVVSMDLDAIRSGIELQAAAVAKEGGVDFTPDIKVNHQYPITAAKANGDLIIGCHTIKYAESKRMAAVLGLLGTGPGSGPAETETQSKGAGDEE